MTKATKEIKKFSDLKEFKSLVLSKTKFTVEEISNILKLYIESV